MKRNATSPSILLGMFLLAMIAAYVIVGVRCVRLGGRPYGVGPMIGCRR